MPKRSYSFAFKIKAVELGKKIGKRPAARKIGIDEKQIRKWTQQEVKLKENAGKEKRCRLRGGGRKPLLADDNVEEQLAEWIMDQRANYIRVTRKSISLQANAIANKPDFKASRGWVDKFLRRFDFVMRQKTTTGQRLPEELSTKVSNFVEFCLKQRIKHALQPEYIGNMDETAIWADMPGTNSIDVKGVKTVLILTTGHEKNRVTVVLGAMADGRKLKPLIVFKGKRTPEDVKNCRGVIIEMSPNGWMQMANTEVGLKKCWGALAFGKRMLVWDSFKCHVADETRSTVKKLNTVMAVIPGGCTKFLQPADVSWNAPFKAAYLELYEAWLMDPERKENNTSSGNPRAPSRAKVIEWVKSAWEAVSTDVIIRSFSACGITTTDADIIHCTKTGNTAEAARESIQSLDPKNYVVNVDIDSSDSGSDSDEPSATDESCASDDSVDV